MVLLIVAGVAVIEPKTAENTPQNDPLARQIQRHRRATTRNCSGDLWSTTMLGRSYVTDKGLLRAV